MTRVGDWRDWPGLTSEARAAGTGVAGLHVGAGAPVEAGAARAGAGGGGGLGQRAEGRAPHGAHPQPRIPRPALARHRLTGAWQGPNQVIELPV